MHEQYLWIGRIQPKLEIKAIMKSDESAVSVGSCSNDGMHKGWCGMAAKCRENTQTCADRFYQSVKWSVDLRFTNLN